jgi:signal peptidase I
MTLYQWFVFFLFIQIVHFRNLEIINEEILEAAIPVIMPLYWKIIGRPTWWTLCYLYQSLTLLCFR